MEVPAVIDDQVQYDLDVSVMALGYELFQVFFRPERRIDRHVIFRIVFMIASRYEYWIQIQGIDPQRLDRVQFVNDSP